MNILLIEDDHNISEIIMKYLMRANYTVNCAFSGKEAREYLRNQTYSFVILDVLLPDANGFDILAELRDGRWSESQASTVSHVPVLMLTALGETTNVVKGLRGGADDYLTKPFEPVELVERVAVILKRSSGRIDIEGVLKVGNLALKPRAREVLCKEMPFALARREFDLLYFLCQNPKRVYSREQLIEHVWGDFFEGSDRAVDLCVQRLRTTLAEHETKIWIRTVWGVGYKMEVID